MALIAALLLSCLGAPTGQTTDGGVGLRALPKSAAVPTWRWAEWRYAHYTGRTRWADLSWRWRTASGKPVCEVVAHLDTWESATPCETCEWSFGITVTDTVVRGDYCDQVISEAAEASVDELVADPATWGADGMYFGYQFLEEPDGGGNVGPTIQVLGRNGWGTGWSNDARGTSVFPIGDSWLWRNRGQDVYRAYYYYP